MDKNLTLGPVELTVADLARSVAYYTEAIGMRLLESDIGRVTVGVPGRPLAVLRENPGAAPAPPSGPGLSHFAPALPARADLARFVRHYARWGDPSLIDHTVAQSAYVEDPDGHTVELTCHRPREEWRWQDGRPAAVADPLSEDLLLGEEGAEEPYRGLPDGTTMGHVQLKATDAGLTATRSFYCDVLGFRLVATLGGSFLGVGAGEDDRAQLVFTNRFGPGSPRPVAGETAGLIAAGLVLSGTAETGALLGRLSAAHHPYRIEAGVLSVRDPSGNLLRFAA
ncbi:glyoxalase [Actinoplanes sp. NBRC 14428]|nr:glyoxalase [Actinoplanes sp. NBRC 14428]